MNASCSSPPTSYIQNQIMLYHHVSQDMYQANECSYISLPTPSIITIRNLRNNRLPTTRLRRLHRTQRPRRLRLRSRRLRRCCDNHLCSTGCARGDRGNDEGSGCAVAYDGGNGVDACAGEKEVCTEVSYFG